jgi:hypothetical protein
MRKLRENGQGNMLCDKALFCSLSLAFVFLQINKTLLMDSCVASLRALARYKRSV